MHRQSSAPITRRSFLKTTALLATGGMLVACAPAAPQTIGTGDTPPAAAAVKIQFWTGWGELTPIFDKLKETPEFKEILAGDDVELKPTVQTEALLTAIAGGTPPDMAAETRYQDLMARGVLHNVADWVSASKRVKEADFIAGNWALTKYKGIQYGIPAFECFVRFGLNYNARLVETAGLDPDKPPVTWSETLAWHSKLTSFDDAGNLKLIGLDPYDAEGSAIGDGFYAARSWGFDWFDEASGKFNLANPQMAEAFDTYAEFYKIVGPDKMTSMRGTEGLGTWGDSYNAEVQAMIIEGYWHPGETAVQKPDVAKVNRSTWAPVPDSRKDAKIQGTGGHMIVFFTEGKNAANGFKFAEFVNSDVACDMIFKQVGWLPAYKPYLDKADTSIFPGLDWYVKSVSEATEIKSPVNCPVTNFAQSTYDELAEKVNRAEMNGADAAAEFQRRCEEEYKAQGFAA